MAVVRAVWVCWEPWLSMGVPVDWVWELTEVVVNVLLIVAPRLAR